MMLIRLALVAAVLVALAVAGGLFVGGTAVARQGASPTAEASPRADSAILVGIPGLEDAAARDFNASGLRLIGTLALRFTATRFDTPEHAVEAIPIIADRYINQVASELGDPSGVRPASVRSLGDQSVGYAGELVPEDDDPSIVFGLVFVRRGAVVQAMAGAALGGDPLTELADIAETVVDREPGEEATPVAADGLRTGGLWDLLPRLADLPEGFVLDEERVPAPFDPLPGQGTPEP